MTIEVHVDYDDGGFAGWVLSSAGPEAPVWCQIVVDLEHRASILADEFLPAIGDRYGGRCCFGFSYRMPVVLCDGRAHRVDLIFAFEKDGAAVHYGLPATFRSFGAPATGETDGPATAHAVCRAQDLPIRLLEGTPDPESMGAAAPAILVTAPRRRMVHAPPREATGAAGFGHAEYVTHPAYLSVLADVVVRPATGAVYVPGKGVWQDARYLSDGGRLRSDLERLERDGAAGLPTLPGPVLLASSAMNRNYFHWLMDVLAGVQAGAQAFGRLPPLLLPPLNGWQGDALRRLLGLPPEAAIPAALPGSWSEDGPGQGLVRCERLIVPSHLGGTAIFPDATVRSLFARLSEGLPQHPSARRRLFVSRRDSDRPRIVNEAALAEALAPLGFELVVPGAMSVEAQARCFREAAVVVGSHGAGLVNVGFCVPGTTVVEILGSHYLNSCFYHLCGLMGHDYYSHTELVAPHNGRAGNAVSFYVDIKRLLVLLERIPALRRGKAEE
ncbi:glycosyltransferase family 61 protein [Azospirillum himalayense]|uniref:Glycosyltransferase family 61 protein n=1 Tax=Azospirillum himalayense TaxID=654847 RepID=A0ABW0G202_9PROT